MTLSPKCARILKSLDVEQYLARHPDVLVLLGPLYAHRKEPGIMIRLAFTRRADGITYIGYAQDSESTGTWDLIESDSFSLRSYGYYPRRLKRLGDYVRTPPITVYHPHDIS